MEEMGYKADVVVSDHHEIPKDGGPKDAYAFINPQRKIAFILIEPFAVVQLHYFNGCNKIKTKIKIQQRY
jgi:hypothetical protein